MFFVVLCLIDSKRSKILQVFGKKIKIFLLLTFCGIYVVAEMLDL